MAAQGTMDMGKRAVENVQYTYKITRESKEEAKSWKSKLSGVLNEQQIFFSLIVIGLFYFAYTITNYSFGDGRDEDYITINCSCEFIHRFLYRLWFSICFAIWFVIYTSTFLEEVLKSPCPTLGKCLEDINHCRPCSKCCLSIFNHVSTCIKYCCSKSNNSESVNNTEGSGTKQTSDSEAKIEAKIQQLWFYYYKLYVVGYKKDQDEWSIDIQEVSTNTNQSTPNPNNTMSNQNSTKGPNDDQRKYTEGSQNKTIPETNNDDNDTQTYTKKQGENPDEGNETLHSKELDNRKNCGWSYLRCYIIYIVFISFKYIAQLATVPLILLQMFDTYSLLCFVPNEEYCTPTSEYRIHAVQTILTVSFYCSLALSLLSSTILDWNPWPKVLTEKPLCESCA